MNTKRLICLLLIVALTFSLSACGTGSSAGSETPGNETQNTGGTNSNTPEEPALVMPDAPTDVLEQMAYNPACLLVTSYGFFLDCNRQKC